MKLTIKIPELLKTSRPISWPNTAVPFVVGYIASTGRIDLLGIIGLIYFCLPYNLLLYGVNDIYDYESDIKNPRKNSIEGGLLEKSKHKELWQLIAATNLPFLIYFIAIGSTMSRILLAALIFFCFSYSAKGLRFKEIPFLDSFNSSLHFVMPFIYGVAIVGGSSYYPLAALAFLFWGMAAQAFGAIQDIGPDREAKINSIATKMGARITTRYSFWLFVATVILVIISFRTKALLPALLLLSYPLNVAFFLKYKSDAQSARFHRGWQNFMWLNFLVGFSLTQILLWHWDPFQLSGQRIAYLFIGLAGMGLAQLIIVLHNFRGLSRPKSARLEEWPKVSIIMHAYNQADNIASTILSVIGQHYPNFEMILCDLGSSDNTLKIAQSYNDKKLKVIDTKPVPAGWTIESWASQQLLDSTTGQVVISMAADTVLLPNAISTITSLLHEQKLDLVSLLPADQNKSIAQKLFLSHNHYFMLGMYPAVYLEKNYPKLASVYSGVIAYDKDAIMSLGGYELTKKSPVSDLDLPTKTKSRHGRTAFYLGSDIAISQNHASWRLIGRQNIQRFYPALRFNMPLTVALFWGGEFLTIGILIGLLGLITSLLTDYIFIILLAYIIGIIPRVIVARESQQNIFATILYPITAPVALFSLIVSMLGYELFRPRWQNRTEASV